jgi:signal recognition particle subunit SRP19
MAASVSPPQLISMGRDRNINMNIGSYGPTRRHSEKSRWVCIYPVYLNSKRTVAQGRQVLLKNGIENPTCQEIRDVLTSANIPCELEITKVHPRELNKYETANRGRVRVQLKKDDGTPLNEAYPDRN